MYTEAVADEVFDGEFRKAFNAKSIPMTPTRPDPRTSIARADQIASAASGHNPRSIRKNVIALARLIANLQGLLGSAKLYFFTDIDGILSAIGGSTFLEEHISVASHKTRHGQSAHQLSEARATVDDNIGKLAIRLRELMVRVANTAATLDRFEPRTEFERLRKEEPDFINDDDPGIFPYQGAGERLGQYFDLVIAGFGAGYAVFERTDDYYEKLEAGLPLTLEDVKTEYVHTIYADQNSPDDPSEAKHAAATWIQEYDSEGLVELMAAAWVDSDDPVELFGRGLGLTQHLSSLNNPSYEEAANVIRKYNEKQRFGLAYHGVEGREDDVNLSPLGQRLLEYMNSVTADFDQLGVNIETFFYGDMLGFNVVTDGAGTNKIQGHQGAVRKGLIPKFDGHKIIYYQGDTGTDRVLMKYYQKYFSWRDDYTVFCVGVGTACDFSKAADIVVGDIDCVASLLDSMSKFGITLGAKDYPAFNRAANSLPFGVGRGMVNCLRAWQFIVGTNHQVAVTELGLRKSQNPDLIDKYSDTMLRRGRALHKIWSDHEKQDIISHETNDQLIARNHGLNRPSMAWLKRTT